MKTSYAATLTLALATLAAGHVMAADVAPNANVPALSHDASGDVVEPMTGLKLREINPARYAANSAVKGKTRAQVQAELMEARRTGDIVVRSSDRDEFTPGTGSKLNELYPSRYPAQAVVQGKTREQVRAELAQAQRTGDMVVAHSARDEFSVTTGNKLNELFPSRYPAN